MQPRRNTSLLLAILAESMGYGAIFGLIADLQDKYSFSNAGLALIASAAFPTALLGQLGLAHFADRGYTRRLLWLGLIFAATGMVWFWLGGHLWEFVIARGLVGLGSGTFIPTARRVVIGRNPDNAGAAVGMAGAADIGGFLVGIPFAKLLESILHSPNTPFLVLAIILVSVGFMAAIHTEEPPVHDPEKLALRAVARLPAARAGLAIAIGFSVAIGTLDAIAARFLKDLGASSGELVLVMMVLAVPLVVFMPFAGRLVDRVGPLKSGAIALAFTAPMLVGYGLTRSLVVIGIIGACQAAANSVVYTAGQAAVANSTARVGLVAAGQGAYEATAAIGGFVCSFSAPFLYDLGTPDHAPGTLPRVDSLPMWVTLGVLVAAAAGASRLMARHADCNDRPLVTPASSASSAPRADEISEVARLSDPDPLSQ
jgi:MFS family permease